MLFTLFSLLILAAACFIIIRTTSRHAITPFFIVIPVAIICGILSGHSLPDILNLVKRGFSETVAGIGLFVIFGHLYGMILYKYGIFGLLAEKLIKLTGKKKASLGLSVTGAVVSVPVPCETAYTLLYPLGLEASEKSGISSASAIISLSSGMYIAHSLILPTPGPLAGAGIINGNVLILFALGLLVSIPAIIAADWFSGRYALKYSTETLPDYTTVYEGQASSFSLVNAFLLLLLPVFFITLKAVSTLRVKPFGNGKVYRIINFTGDPVIAIMIGIGLVLFLAWRKKAALNFSETTLGSIKQSMIVVAAAGSAGAFAAVFRTSSIMSIVPDTLPHWCGLLIPFITAVLFKLLHGSSTIAIITACSLTAAPVMIMRLSPELAVLAAGAGAMTVSHINDPYFWLVSRLSGLPVRTTFRLFTFVTLITGLVSFAMIFILGIFM